MSVGASFDVPRWQAIFKAAPRIGLGGVFMYFGGEELFRPGPWVGYLPHMGQGIATFLILAHGLALFVVGAALVVGFALRIATWIGALLMISISLDLLVTSGVGAIWVRDAGLSLLSLGLIAERNHTLTLDEP